MNNNNNEKKNEEIKTKILATHISEMAKAIFFKFGMWGGLPGGHLYSENGSNRMKDNRATKV